jgi:hypothetical protein
MQITEGRKISYLQIRHLPYESVQHLILIAVQTGEKFLQHNNHQQLKPVYVPSTEFYGD